ncbi:MAG TPA: hypothetical protein VHC69_08685 [Polyangiaceae bacterium]|nr:hypothetical protein [Polyangiaceae bacterium]
MTEISGGDGATLSALLPRARPRTVRAAVAIGSALFGRAESEPPPERLAYLAREFEDFLLRSGPRARTMLTILVWLVATTAPLFIGRIGTLAALAQANRVRALDRLERRFGEPLVAVKAILCLIYYEHPDAAREIGFDGECLLPRTPP